MSRRIVLDVAGIMPAASSRARSIAVEHVLAAAPVALESFFLREARLGIVLWERVPFRHRQMRAAGVLELFVVDSALALDRMRLEDLSEMTGAAVELLERFATHLTFAGALVREPGALYRVVRAEAERIRDERRVPEVVLRRAYVAYVPESDMAFALSEKARRALRGLVAPAQAPLGRRDESVGTFLATRAATGRIAGLAPDFVSMDPWPDEPGWETTCPCFFVRGPVARNPTAASVTLTLFGETRKGGWISEALPVPARPELLVPWRTLNLALSVEETREDVSEILFGTPGVLRDAVLTGEGVWRVPLPAAAARIVAARGWLVARWPLALSTEFAKVETALEFEPGDDEARVLFALDHVAASLERGRKAPSVGQLAEQWTTACSLLSIQARLDVAALLARLWDRKAFGAVYALRAQEDFAGD